MQTAVAILVEYLTTVSPNLDALEAAERLDVAVYAVPTTDLMFTRAEYFCVRGRHIIHVDEDLDGLELEHSIWHEIGHVLAADFGLGDDTDREELLCDLIAIDLLSRGLQRSSAARLQHAEALAFDEVVECDRPSEYRLVSAAVGAA